ncbi:2'-5' RNA ligase family protein [Deinococcus hopiensis]|uniref:2'-5' RNA ligase family protein n=1 Tax=Deinococcus hopiensis TaxID=309885 RepID=UPI003CCC31F7
MFPEQLSGTFIHEVRHLYDPLEPLIHLHLTVVFPFNDSTPTTELAALLQARLASFRPLDIHPGEATAHGEYCS